MSVELIVAALGVATGVLGIGAAWLGKHRTTLHRHEIVSMPQDVIPPTISETQPQTENPLTTEKLVQSTAFKPLIQNRTARPKLLYKIKIQVGVWPVAKRTSGTPRCQVFVYEDRIKCVGPQAEYSQMSRNFVLTASDLAKAEVDYLDEDSPGSDWQIVSIVSGSIQYYFRGCGVRVCDLFQQSIEDMLHKLVDVEAVSH